MISDERINKILYKNDGVISTAEAKAVGVSREWMRLLAKNGELERVDRGVYITPETFEDKLYVLQKLRPKIIYSHETALFLYDLTDRTPIRYTVTVPTGYRSKKLIDENLEIHTVIKDNYELGITQTDSYFGHNVRVYDMERTVCDILKNRNKMDIQVFTDAMKRYSRKDNIQLHQLMKYAKILRVEKLLRQYLEVLL